MYPSPSPVLTRPAPTRGMDPLRQACGPRRYLMASPALEHRMSDAAYLPAEDLPAAHGRGGPLASGSATWRREGSGL